MSREQTVEIELLEDDLDPILRAAGVARGQASQALGDLLADGLAHYLRDEAEWGALSGAGRSGEHDIRLMELKRRESRALTVSMRARTIASEIRMEALLTHVRGLQEQHAALRQRMNDLRRTVGQLRRDCDRLRASLSAAGAPPIAPPATTPGIGGRLHRLLKSCLGRR
jgi:hypothetical protein